MGVEKFKRKLLVVEPGSDIAGVPLDFTTAEQETDMKWIDGKTIYRKTVTITTWPKNNTESKGTGITNMETVVRVEGAGKITDGDGWITLPRVGAGDTLTNLLDVFVSAAGTTLYLASTGDYTATGLNATEGAVTIWYTKTS